MKLHEDINRAFAPFLNDNQTTATASASIEAAAVKEVEPQEKTAVIAKSGYNAIGVCPYCNNLMDRTIACGQEVYLCRADRFVSPLPDANVVFKEEPLRFSHD